MRSLLWAVFLLAGCHFVNRLEAPSYASDGDEERRVISDEPARPTARTRAVTERPFVWEVTKRGKTSHLFGTIHVGISLDEALPPRMQDALSNARVVMLEIDPRTVDPQRLLSAARLPEGKHQEDFYPARVWHDLVNALNENMTSAMLRQLRPWFTMILLVQATVAKMHGEHPPEGMDVTIFQMASDMEQPVRALETVDTQVAALASVPDETIARIVTRSLAQDGTTELARLLDAYSSADVERVEAITFDEEDMARAPDFFAAMFDRRNDAWMGPLREELDRGDAFVAVGLGHLLGDRGLLARLDRAGYSIRRAR